MRADCPGLACSESEPRGSSAGIDRMRRASPGQWGIAGQMVDQVAVEADKRRQSHELSFGDDVMDIAAYEMAEVQSPSVDRPRTGQGPRLRRARNCETARWCRRCVSEAFATRRLHVPDSTVGHPQQDPRQHPDRRRRWGFRGPAACEGCRCRTPRACATARGRACAGAASFPPLPGLQVAFPWCPIRKCPDSFASALAVSLPFRSPGTRPLLTTRTREDERCDTRRGDGSWAVRRCS